MSFQTPRSVEEMLIAIHQRVRVRERLVSALGATPASAPAED